RITKHLSHLHGRLILRPSPVTIHFQCVNPFPKFDQKGQKRCQMAFPSNRFDIPEGVVEYDKCLWKRIDPGKQLCKVSPFALRVTAELRHQRSHKFGRQIVNPEVKETDAERNGPFE